VKVVCIMIPVRTRVHINDLWRNRIAHWELMVMVPV